MKAVLAFIISQSILFPIIIGFVRFRTIKTDYQPLFWSLVFGFLAEIIIAPMLTRLERLYRKRRAKRLEERLKDAASSCS